MLGLTGGIGAGKSTVADMLAQKGALVIDTDVIAREVVQPGGTVHDQVVARFGTVDRAGLARVVFSDPDALAALNRIVHPAVADVVRERLAGAEVAGAEVVVLVVPLLVEAGWTDRVDKVLVVDAPEDVAVSRVAASGRLSEDEVRRRMAAQASRAERLSHADLVIENGGSLDELERRVDEAWATLAR